MKFFEELKRRNVIKATMAYIVVAWVLVQVLTIILPEFEAPGWVLKTLIILMVVGLPIWMIFSWVYEVTPEGIKPDSAVSATQGPSSQNQGFIYATFGLVLLVGP